LLACGLTARLRLIDADGDVLAQVEPLAERELGEESAQEAVEDVVDVPDEEGAGLDVEDLEEETLEAAVADEGDEADGACLANVGLGSGADLEGVLLAELAQTGDCGLAEKEVLADEGVEQVRHEVVEFDAFGGEEVKLLEAFGGLGADHGVSVDLHDGAGGEAGDAHLAGGLRGGLELWAHEGDERIEELACRKK